MNNLKKVGLSALAGSLVAMSAQAADISFSGGASVGMYQESEDAKTLFYNNDSLTITVSGETDGGLTITNTMELDGSSASAGGFDNSITTIAMDGMGTITYGRHGASSVVGGWDSIAPTAYEEVWDVVETTASVANNVIGGTSGNGLWRYDSPSFSGLTFSASYDSSVAGGTADPSVSTYHDMGISIAPEMVEGLSIGYATGNYEETAAIGDIDVSTLWVKYAYGPVTVSYQESEEDATTAANSNDSEEFGISYAVSDDFSVSYGTHEYNDGTDASTDNQESSGISASYTMAGTTIAASFNETDNADSITTEDTEGFEINVSFAF
jgi:outer membrane protein OmpU